MLIFEDSKVAPPRPFDSSIDAQQGRLPKAGVYR